MVAVALAPRVPLFLRLLLFTLVLSFLLFPPYHQISLPQLLLLIQLAHPTQKVVITKTLDELVVFITELAGSSFYPLVVAVCLCSWCRIRVPMESSFQLSFEKLDRDALLQMCFQVVYKY